MRASDPRIEKSNRRRQLALPLSLITALALGGCAAATPAPSGAEGDTLSIVWESGSKAALDVMIEEFQKENAGVTIVPEYLDSGSIKTQIPTRLASGTAPDIFRTEAGRGSTIAVQHLASKGFLAEVTGPNTTSVPEIATETLSLDGKVYGYTPVLASIGQIINNEALKESGLSVPTKWSEVLSFCQDARDAGLVAYAHGPVSLHENQAIPYALAGQLVFDVVDGFNEQMADGSLTFAESPWSALIERHLKMADAGCYPDDFTGNDMQSVIESISTAKTIGMVGYTGYLPYTAGSDATFSLYPLPGSEDPDESRLVVYPFASFGINAKSKSPELAQKFIDFIASPEMSALYAATVSPVGGLLPSSYSVGDAPDDQLSQTMIEYLESGRSIQAPDAYWPNPQVQLAHQSGIQEIVQGTRTIDEVLAVMQDAYDIGPAN